MPTIIEFTGRDRGVRVVQDTEEVLAAFRSANGAPTPFERIDGDRVYVNPKTVAYWHTYEDVISPGRLDPR